MARKPSPNPFPGMSLMIEPTPADIYLLGFLWADAHITSERVVKKKKEHSIRLEINNKDGRNLKQLIMSTGLWNYSERKRKERAKHPLSLFAKNNKFFHSFLVNNGYDRRTRGADEILAIIPRHLHFMWFRGFFDGDGHVGVNWDSSSFACSMSGEFNQNWRFLTRTLTELGINYSITRNTTKKGHQYSYVAILGGRQGVLEFASYLYGPNLIWDGLGLKRKFERFKQIKETPSFDELNNYGKYRQVCPKTGKIRDFLSKRELEAAGFSSHLVRTCIRGEHDHHKGFVWEEVA